MKTHLSLALIVAAFLAMPLAMNGCTVHHEESTRKNLLGGSTHEETTTTRNPITGDTSTEHSKDTTR
jgi:hypothetical protein